ncbi:hypothetical protein [Paracoccus sphaerophysae]|uniref:hypothetical protein n=1 Tax=Paracoccus sphaerophysae TaxID=690417 RepID=UPI0012EB371D|nr:hypothetical protein [Paracoccus sphaerophysae]
MAAIDFEDEVEVVILIKAAPEIGRRHGETVCVAGLDRYGRWHRLYPVPYKDLQQSQRFNRWDRVRVRWRRPGDDNRPESKRIDPQSLRVVGAVPQAERGAFIERAIVRSLEVEYSSGRSLALIRPERPELRIKRLSAHELAKSQRRRDELHAQADMFANAEIPKQAPPYSFRFVFEHAGKQREYQCLDWETEWTFFKWREKYGEDATLKMMIETWSSFRDRGLVFAMGTHRVSHWRNWLLSGLIRIDQPQQGQFAL